jgi:hypothetical protein
LIPSTSVKTSTPNFGNPKTIKDTANDNAPTPIRKLFDHFEIFLSDRPWMILAIPTKRRPRASKLTNRPTANIGKARTATPNRATNAPRPILPNRDDFEYFGSVKPVATLSIPTTSNVTESRKVRVAIPTPGLTITASDSATAIPPNMIWKIRIPLGDLIVSVFKLTHMQIMQLLQFLIPKILLLFVLHIIIK